MALFAGWNLLACGGHLRLQPDEFRLDRVAFVEAEPAAQALRLAGCAVRELRIGMQTRHRRISPCALAMLPGGDARAKGVSRRLFSFVCAVNPSAPLSITQFWTRRSVKVSSLPLRSHNAKRTESRVGTTRAPNATWLGSTRSLSRIPFSSRRHSSRGSAISFLVHNVGTCVWAR